LAGKACIVEIEFGTFDDPLIEVAVVGREEKKDEAGFEDENPSARCVNGNAAV
jgi:hypothetical protein